MIFKYLFAVNVFLSAFLLFLIQPLIGKILTPAYGGGSQVWILCLFFFQFALLGGYTLTYFISKVQKNYQAAIYILLVALSLLMLKIPMGQDIQPDFSNPVISLLSLLSKYLLVPLVFVSSVSTLIQNWFVISKNENPYFLYSISNVGSVMALFLFPLALEPNFPVEFTTNLWKGAYWLLAILVITSATLVLKQKSAIKAVEAPEKSEIPIKRLLMWVWLSFMGTSLLLSYTAYITHDIAPVPMLWIIPLGLYLATFIIIFGGDEIYNRSFYVFAAYFFPTLLLTQASHSVLFKIVLTLCILYSLLMVCHGELYAIRPGHRRLPLFYLCIALGGALGGFFINLGAPLLFKSNIEFIVLNIMAFGFILFTIFRQNLRVFFNENIDKTFRICTIIVLGYFAWIHLEDEISKFHNPNITEKRNFYGSITVKETKEALRLLNGHILHGFQAINEKTGKLIFEPTSYYSKLSPLGISIALYREKTANKPINIGAIGLGAGTLAYYGNKGDVIDFYEIDPKVIDIAQDKFSFIQSSKARVNIILGDGRLNLAKTSPEKYDIIIVDAFNSDAVPMHLLTEEARGLYIKHLKPKGLLLFHVSNKYLNLYKLMDGTLVSAESTDKDKHLTPSNYVVISKGDWFSREKIDYPHITVKKNRQTNVWTDDFSDILSVFK